MAKSMSMRKGKGITCTGIIERQPIGATKQPTVK